MRSLGIPLILVGVITLGIWVGLYLAIPNHPLNAKETTVVAFVVAAACFLVKWLFGGRSKTGPQEKQ